MRFVQRAATLIFLSSFSAHALSNLPVVDVGTFNTGLHEYGIWAFGWHGTNDFVKCIKGRRDAQIKEIGNIIHSHRDKPFVILLQEVMNKSSYQMFLKLAEFYKINITGGKNIADRGLVTITNGKIVSEEFTPFPCDNINQYTYGFNPFHRGVLKTDIIFDGRNKLTVLNTQTKPSGPKESDACHYRQLQKIYEVASNQDPLIPTVLGGDLNTGANHTFRQGQKYKPAQYLWEPFYSWMTSDENRAPFKELPLPLNQVSWDFKGNPWASSQSWFADRAENNFTPEHLFISNGFIESQAPIATSKLLFIKKFEIKNCEGLTPKSGEGFLSNHYGVWAPLHIGRYEPRPVSVEKPQVLPPKPKPAPKRVVTPPKPKRTALTGSQKKSSAKQTPQSQKPNTTPAINKILVDSTKVFIKPTATKAKLDTTKAAVKIGPKITVFDSTKSVVRMGPKKTPTDSTKTGTKKPKGKEKRPYI